MSTSTYAHVGGGGGVGLGAAPESVWPHSAGLSAQETILNEPDAGEEQIRERGGRAGGRIGPFGDLLTDPTVTATATAAAAAVVAAAELGLGASSSDPLAAPAGGTPPSKHK